MPSLDMRVSTVTTCVCRLNRVIITFFYKVLYLNNNILLIYHIIVPSVHEVLMLVFYIYLLYVSCDCTYPGNIKLTL